MKYDEFKTKKKALGNQKKEFKKKIAGINKQKLQVKLDQNNQKRAEIAKKMSNFVNGSSIYN